MLGWGSGVDGRRLRGRASGGSGSPEEAGLVEYL